MGFTIQQDQAKVKAARQFQIHADLRDVQLLDCSGRIAETRAESEGRLLLGLRLETTVLSSVQGCARFAVRIAVHGDPKGGEGKPEQHLFEVACRYSLQYALKAGYTPSQEELEAFKEGNAVFQCWPYSRELVQNLTMRMGVQMPPLPFLRLAPKPVTKKPAVGRSSPEREDAVAEKPPGRS
jgi:hypothetical protein